MTQLDRIGDTMEKQVIGQQMQQKIFKRNNHQEKVETDTEIDPIVGIEITQDIVTGIEVQIEEDQTQERIENNQQRSGSSQRYYDREDIFDYCNRNGHSTCECFKLENYLRKQGKKNSVA